MKNIRLLSSALAQTLTVASLLWANTASAQQVTEVYDPFDYPILSLTRRIPAPWVWSVSGQSTNTLALERVGNIVNEVGVVHYGGSGWWSLDRYDVAGANAVYSIDFWDDGSAPVGEMFQVYTSDNDFIAIAANDNVAPGQYYVRTASNSGNTGTIIPVARNSSVSNNGWHTFYITVTPLGSYPTVDCTSIPGYLYNGVTSVDHITLVGNWGKKAHDSRWDNFRVQSLGETTIPNGTRVLTDGELYSPSGVESFASLSAWDLAKIYSVGDGAVWAQSHPERAAVVQRALGEVGANNVGLCGDSARSRYDASGEWCSEFARWVLLNSAGFQDFWYLHAGTIWYQFSALESTSALISAYRWRSCGYTDGPAVLTSTPEPGDFVAEVGTKSGPYGHSEIVVAKSWDGRYIWTVGGNVGDCVSFQKRDFFVDGHLASNLNAFGNTLALETQILSGRSPSCKYVTP